MGAKLSVELRLDNPPNNGAFSRERAISGCLVLVNKSKKPIKLQFRARVSVQGRVRTGVTGQCRSSPDGKYEDEETFWKVGHELEEALLPKGSKVEPGVTELKFSYPLPKGCLTSGIIVKAG